MSLKYFWIALPLAIIAVAAFVLWRDDVAPAAVATAPACADLTQGCSAGLTGRAVRYGMAGPLKVLKPFQVWVQAPGATSVQARFSMVDMDMGFNVYTLIADADGVFRAVVTLPVCITGRRDWIMDIEIDGTRFQAPFSTEL